MAANKVQLLCLQLWLGFFLHTTLKCFTYNCNFAYNGKARLISTSRDCKQRSSTVGKKPPTVSKEASPKQKPNPPPLPSDILPFPCVHPPPPRIRPPPSLFSIQQTTPPRPPAMHPLVPLPSLQNRENIRNIQKYPPRLPLTTFIEVCLLAKVTLPKVTDK